MFVRLREVRFQRRFRCGRLFLAGYDLCDDIRNGWLAKKRIALRLPNWLAHAGSEKVTSEPIHLSLALPILAEQWRFAFLGRYQVLGKV